MHYIIFRERLPINIISFHILKLFDISYNYIFLIVYEFVTYINNQNTSYKWVSIIESKTTQRHQSNYLC